ncbi:MAG TPA: ubiquinol oxidase subunit II [Steroidobacteraceae bacterium]|jgi:cytochrome o ubiquinol oxidase subunit 2|nr:ubiquinol oxidase subunit II [Steroidobacteraceae bacterium]
MRMPIKTCAVLVLFETACTSSGVLDPHGPIGGAERSILFDATVIMLAVVVPVILATGLFAWWFRAGNRKARRRPDWSYAGRIEFVVWAIPALVVLFLGGIGWISSHDLDPRTRLPSSSSPIEVEVVSLDWKWLFIYPGLRIASVNRLVAPVGTPLHFRLTSAGVMNSFFIPQLGSQIYTMAGMATELNLQADDQGTYPGLSAQFSGDGFSDMRFEVAAISPQAFAQWIDATRAHGGSLGPEEYAELARPSQKNEPRTFAVVSPKLFEAILASPGAAPRENPK